MLGSEKLTIVLSIYELLAAILRNHVNHFGKEFAVKIKENSENRMNRLLRAQNMII